MDKRVIDGRFLVLQTLGEGAAGEVVEASVLQDTSYAAKGTRVAIKIYGPWVLAENPARETKDLKLRPSSALELFRGKEASMDARVNNGTP